MTTFWLVDSTGRRSAIMPDPDGGWMLCLGEDPDTGEELYPERFLTLAGLVRAVGVEPDEKVQELLDQEAAG